MKIHDPIPHPPNLKSTSSSIVIVRKYHFQMALKTHNFNQNTRKMIPNNLMKVIVCRLQSGCDLTHYFISKFHFDYAMRIWSEWDLNLRQTHLSLFLSDSITPKAQGNQKRFQECRRTKHVIKNNHIYVVN